MTRGYVAGHFAIELDGLNAGWLYGYEGGMAQCEVVSEKTGPDMLVHKHIGGLKYDDITINCGTSMSPVFHDWLKASLARQYERKDGALIQADYNFHEMVRLNFHQALITEIGLPACDASSREMCKLTVKMSPEYTRIEKKQDDGGFNLHVDVKFPSLAGKFPINPPAQKKWLCRNFRLEIDGLEKACTHVSKIEALTVKQKVTEVPLGSEREIWREPAAIEYPNLVITLPEANADGFYRWYKSFMIEGRSDQEHEKEGTLTYLAEDLKTELCVVTFRNLGLFKLSVDKAEAGSEKIRCVKAEMYCEQLDFDFKPSAMSARDKLENAVKKIIEKEIDKALEQTGLKPVVDAAKKLF